MELAALFSVLGIIVIPFAIILGISYLLNNVQRKKRIRANKVINHAIIDLGEHGVITRAATRSVRLELHKEKFQCNNPLELAILKYGFKNSKSLTAKKFHSNILANLESLYAVASNQKNNTDMPVKDRIAMTPNLTFIPLVMLGDDENDPNPANSSYAGDSGYLAIVAGSGSSDYSGIGGDSGGGGDGGGGGAD